MMASLVKYDTTEEYFRVQVRANRRKYARISTPQEEVDAIAVWLRNNRPNASTGLCHGARNGWEIDAFATATGHDVRGTDIAPVEHPRMIQWDFHHPRIEWHGKIDWIYSNAIDHAWCPRVALFTWFETVAAEGVLFLPWHKGKLKGRRTDPFAVSLDEYRVMIEEFGVLTDGFNVITASGYKVVMLVGRRKDDVPLAR